MIIYRLKDKKWQRQFTNSGNSRYMMDELALVQAGETKRMPASLLFTP